MTVEHSVNTHVVCNVCCGNQRQLARRTNPQGTAGLLDRKRLPIRLWHSSNELKELPKGLMDTVANVFD